MYGEDEDGGILLFELREEMVQTESERCCRKHHADTSTRHEHDMESLPTHAYPYQEAKEDTVHSCPRVRTSIYLSAGSRPREQTKKIDLHREARKFERHEHQRRAGTRKHRQPLASGAGSGSDLHSVETISKRPNTPYYIIDIMRGSTT